MNKQKETVVFGALQGIQHELVKIDNDIKKIPDSEKQCLIKSDVNL